jgi:uncharacterized membrane protein
MIKNVFSGLIVIFIIVVLFFLFQQYEGCNDAKIMTKLLDAEDKASNMNSISRGFYKKGYYSCMNKNNFGM